MRIQSLFERAVGRKSWTRHRADQQNTVHFQQMTYPAKAYGKSCVFSDKKNSWTCLAICRRALVCLKLASRMPWKKRAITASNTSLVHLLRFRIFIIRCSWNRSWYAIAIQTPIPSVRPVWCSIMYSRRWHISV